MDTQESEKNTKMVNTQKERIKSLMESRPQANWSVRTVWINDTAYEMNFASEPTVVVRLFAEIEAVVTRDCPDLNVNSMISSVYHPDVTRQMTWGSIRNALGAQRQAVKASAETPKKKAKKDASA